MISACPVFEAPNFIDLHQARMPLFLLMRPPETAGLENFDTLGICICNTCGHMFNRAFTPELAGRMYVDVPLTNVPVHLSMHQRFLDLINWVPNGALKGERALEIGCGSGRVARLLAKHARHVTSFKPCNPIVKIHGSPTKHTFGTGYFSERRRRKQSVFRRGLEKTIAWFANPQNFDAYRSHP